MKIEIKNVGKKFKNSEVLKNISTDFETGKIYGITGRNGSGKSVFLKLICGLYKPTEGQIIINGNILDAQKSFPSNTRALIERPCFFPNLTGFENLKLLAQIQNKIGDKEILETLKIVNLLNEKDKKFHEYSLGMKQKLGIAQVLMENPDILIFDEPFNGVEEETIKKIQNYLIKLSKENKLIIISSHVITDLENVVDKIYHFDAGVLIEK